MVNPMPPSKKKHQKIIKHPQFMIATIYIKSLIVTSSTAQGGGGSFNIGNLKERLVVVNLGWQSETTD